MTRFHLEVRVKPRPGLLDPQGKATHHALTSLGHEGVAAVRIGKVMDLEIDAPDAETAVERTEEMCRKLLANPVTEDFSVSLLGEVEREEAEA
ncbi:MAG: phosphoribosylformylglycinamidine synthase subunit PurS [Gemmatimonadales bacterium]|nr:MAG: phosphoribosylformylglycinamidine synthase subunit PurS [Gemmatimonadales bacterium]